MAENKFSINYVPDYIKQDYSYDSKANDKDITLSGALNTTLMTQSGKKISSNDILNATGSAKVNTDGYTTEGGPIVFQINLPEPFLYSTRGDKRITIRAIWFWCKDNQSMTSYLNNYLNAIKINTTLDGDGNVDSIIETIDFTGPKDIEFNEVNPFPFGPYNNIKDEDTNRWKFIAQRRLYENNYDKYPSNLDLIQPNKMYDVNGSLISLPAYYIKSGDDFSLSAEDGDNEKYYEWSNWIITESTEILSNITQYDSIDIATDTYRKVNAISKTDGNIINNIIDNKMYSVLNQSNSENSMSLITCPVISTLTAMTGSKGITSMMSNTPYDHPTEFISNSLPYFLVAFAKPDGTLYEIPSGVKVSDYCRVFVELTVFY